MKKGFTLIELLVVVLIIGILAAVAMPQYQKAVTKSRAAKYWPILKTLYEAKTVCELAKGEACTSLDELDVSVEQSSEIDSFVFKGQDVGQGEGSSYPDVAVWLSMPGYGGNQLLGLDRGHRLCAGEEFCPAIGFTHFYGDMGTACYTDEEGVTLPSSDDDE